MTKPDLDLYTDYLLSTFGATTATGLSAMVEGEVSHDQVTRFLSAQQYTSKDLWQSVKRTVRSLESDDGVLIFDDTIQEKAWSDESELMCWHFDHCSVNGWPWHLEQIRPLSQHRVHANHRGHLCSKIQKPPDTQARAFTALTAPHSRPNWSLPASSLVLPLPHWPWPMG